MTKALKIIAFIAIVGYWIVGIDEQIKGEGIVGSLFGIVILIVFVFGAYTLFFDPSDSNKK